MAKGKEYRQKGQMSLFKLFALATACVAITATVGFFTLWYFFAPRDNGARLVTVPQFVGVSEDSLELPDKITVEKQYEFSSAADAGNVISQSPPKGSRRKCKDGESVCVRVTVSLGERRQVIPDVKGMTCAAAALRLREIGAEVVSVDVYDSGRDSGTVLSSSPPADTEIGDGARVVIYVAKNRVKASVKVPSLIGMRRSDACVLLMSRGLVLGDTVYAEGDADAVLAQSLPADAYVSHGSRIDLTVGKAREGDSEEHTEDGAQEGGAQEGGRTKINRPFWRYTH